MTRRKSQPGFTLVEMIVVIVITGIIGGMVAIFLRVPIQQYFATARRADMTDIADTSLRRIGRDLRLALPNSVRVTGTCGAVGSTCFIEFLPTRGGGRYRMGAPGNILNFSAPVTSFDVLGLPMPVNAYAANSDRIVVYNQGTTGANAYAGDNTGVYASNTATTITISPGKQFPLESPSARFQVITTPVSYVCAPAVNGIGGTLTRYWGYPIQPLQSAVDTVAKLVALTTAATRAQLATNVSTCNFNYDANVVAQRSGLVTINLGITEDNETVTLYSATHVSNVP
jgi:MSHA biogenesis protein MshO